jgi:hypothetical protein
MAFMGLVSGILSATIGFDHEWDALRPVATLVFLDPGPLPVGFFFATVIALSMVVWVRPPWAALLGFVVTMYAWSGAIHTAIRLQRNRDDELHLIAASLCAGAVGAGLTHLGCALFVRELRRPWRIGLTCIVGAILGMLFYLGQRKYLDERLLFVIWQPAVAFCIGLGLEGRKPIATSVRG